jgi:hypothetical protein
MYLEVTLVNGQNYSIPIDEGHSLRQELELFLNREGRYEGGWVPLQKAGRELTSTTSRSSSSAQRRKGRE